MVYLVIDNYLDKKDKYPFADLKSAFQFMIQLRRGYREQHASGNKVHHRVYVLRSDPFIFCRHCKHFFHDAEDAKTQCCDYCEVIKEENYCRIKNFRHL